MSFLDPFNLNGPRRGRRKKLWKSWPIRLGWDTEDLPATFFFWHDWPIDGPSIWAADAYLEYGQTYHLGPLKIHLGG